MSPESIYYVIASTAFPIGAAWALVQWHQTIRQRKAELRWRQAEAAWKLLDDIFTENSSGPTLQILDNERDLIPVHGVGDMPICRTEFLKCLCLKGEQNSSLARACRHLMDIALFDFERIDQAISSSYIEEEDIRTPTLYYSIIMYKHREAIFPYARHVGYTRAIRLIERLAIEAEPPSSPEALPLAA